MLLVVGCLLRVVACCLIVLFEVCSSLACLLLFVVGCELFVGCGSLVVVCCIVCVVCCLLFGLRCLCVGCPLFVI